MCPLKDCYSKHSCNSRTKIPHNLNMTNDETHNQLHIQFTPQIYGTNVPWNLLLDLLFLFPQKGVLTIWLKSETGVLLCEILVPIPNCNQEFEFQLYLPSDQLVFQYWRQIAEAQHLCQQRQMWRRTRQLCWDFYSSTLQVDKKTNIAHLHHIVHEAWQFKANSRPFSKTVSTKDH